MFCCRWFTSIVPPQVGRLTSVMFLVHFYRSSTSVQASATVMFLVHLLSFLHKWGGRLCLSVSVHVFMFQCLWTRFYCFTWLRRVKSYGVQNFTQKCYYSDHMWLLLHAIKCNLAARDLNRYITETTSKRDVRRVSDATDLAYMVCSYGFSFFEKMTPRRGASAYFDALSQCFLRRPDAPRGGVR